MLYIGERVELQIRSRDDKLSSTTGYRDWILRGTVIPRYTWAEADTVCVHTDCENVPNRVVSIGKILGVKKLGSGAVAETPQIPTWTVAGSRGSVYTVKMVKRKYSCSCPGFQFRNHCRHVEQIRNQKAAA